MAVQVTWEGCGVMWKFSGLVTPEEFLLTMRDTHADPRFDHVRFCISDYTEITGSMVDLEDVDLFSAYSHSATQSKYLVVAVVANNEETGAKVARFALGVAYPLAVFNNLPEARDWIQYKLKVV